MNKSTVAAEPKNQILLRLPYNFGSALAERIISRLSLWASTNLGLSPFGAAMEDRGTERLLDRMGGREGGESR